MNERPVSIAHSTLRWPALLGRVLFTGGVLLFGISAFWPWFLSRATPFDRIGTLRIPLIFALAGCAIAGGGLFLISCAQDTTPPRSLGLKLVRALVATLGALLLWPALPLLALGAYGFYLLFAPDPAPGEHHNLGQGFGGALLMMYCGGPGLVLGGLGAFLLDRARRS